MKSYDRHILLLCLKDQPSILHSLIRVFVVFIFWIANLLYGANKDSNNTKWMYGLLVYFGVHLSEGKFS